MPRGVRKAASDSTTQALADARSPDVSTAPVPEIAGTELLDDTGREFYETLWRSDSTKWSAGDLHLILDAALNHQKLHIERMIAAMTPTLTTFANGTIGRHPQHLVVADLAKRLADNLRALGARSRDGAKAAPSRAAVIAAKATATGENVMSFEEYLNDD